MSDESSEYTSSEAESSDSDEPQQLLTKPIFIKRAKSKPTEANIPDSGASDLADKLIKNMENDNNKRAQLDLDTGFDGVDDTDGLDPEKEYNDWRAREYKRYLTARESIIEIENEQYDKLKRKNLTQQELEQVHEIRQDTNNRVKSNQSSYNIGAFGDDDEFKKKIQNRDYREKKLDHSRPTRFKLNDKL